MLEPRAASFVRLFGCACLLLASLAFSPAARAQVGVHAAGGHVGVRLDPDQLVLGGHADVWQHGETLRLRGVGSVGLGTGVTILDLRPELHYVAAGAPLSEGVLFYTGIGFDMANIWLEKGHNVADTDFGLILLGGMEKRLGNGVSLMGELNVRVDEQNEWFVLQAGFSVPF